MTKKITVYTVLTVLLVALIFANVYAINLAIWRLGVRTKTGNPEELTSLTAIEKDDSQGFELFTLSEEVRYSDLFFGMVDAGNKATFSVESGGKDVLVEIYCVEAFKCVYSTEQKYQTVDLSGGSHQYIVSKYNVYEDGVSEFSFYSGNDQCFVIIHGGDAEEIIVDLVA